MPETEPNLCLTSKRRVGIVELKNHTQVNQTQKKGRKTRSMVEHPAETWHSIRSEAPNAKLLGVEGQKHRRGYEAKICDSPSQAIAKRRYRGSMELVAEPDAHNAGIGSPLSGSRSTPENTVPLLFYPVWLFSVTFDFSNLFYTHTSFFILKI